MGADAGGAHRQRYLRAVQSISRSQWNDCFGADPGPSRGDPCRRAYRPNASGVRAGGTFEHLEPGAQEATSCAFFNDESG